MSITDSQIVNQSCVAPFGERLKDVFGNIQNKEIATLLGVSNPAVTAYLRGRIPPAEKLVEIASLTGCSLHWLLTGEGSRRLIDNPSRPDRWAKTILFHCGKGGVGTSTVALLTAVMFANRGYKTLLVDNVYGSCTEGLFYRALTRDRKIKPAPRKSSSLESGTDHDGRMFFNTPVRGLDLISYHPGYQSVLSRERIDHFDVMPSEVLEKYSYVVFDGHSHINPFHPTDLFRAPLLQEAKVFIPYEPCNSSPRSVRTTLKYVSSAQRDSRGVEFMGLFINNFNPTRSVNVRLRREIESLCSSKMLRSVVHSSPELSDVIPERLENFYQKKSKLFREFSSLVTEIQERLEDVRQVRGHSRKVS